MRRGILEILRVIRPKRYHPESGVLVISGEQRRTTLADNLGAWGERSNRPAPTNGIRKMGPAWLRLP